MVLTGTTEPTEVNVVKATADFFRFIGLIKLPRRGREQFDGLTPALGASESRGWELEKIHVR